jgi:hypothetical protein
MLIFPSRHVLNDLFPYVCTFRDCSASLFSSRHEWFEHELVNHRRRWVCNVCRECFATVDEFSDHARVSHVDVALNADEIHGLALWSEHSEQACPDKCPLCEEWGRDIYQRQSLPISIFQKHLGRHLENLALFALPRPWEEGPRADFSMATVNKEEASAGTTRSPHISTIMELGDPMSEVTDRTDLGSITGSYATFAAALGSTVYAASSAFSTLRTPSTPWDAHSYTYASIYPPAASSQLLDSRTSFLNRQVQPNLKQF